MPQDEEIEIFQHYRVLRRDDGSLWELGRGSMGITYKAIDTNLHASVALKVVNLQLIDSQEARDRFVREARAAASLRHPNVASVYHLGHDEQSVFYAMEFVEGETLECLVERTGPMSWESVLPIAHQVARALNAAHVSKVVHRDIKPSNIMLVQIDGTSVVKVIDFGLAKLLQDTGPLRANRSFGIIGTPLYASPEQCDEQPADIRSDIYGLGATMWFLLVGKPPFTGNLARLLEYHIHQPPDWTELPVSVPGGVRALLARMLAKDRSDRPQTPAELRLEIEACLNPASEITYSSTVELPARLRDPALDATSVDAGPAVSATYIGLAPANTAPRTSFGLDQCLRQGGGRLPSAWVADLIGPLARIADDAGTAPLDLTFRGVWIIPDDEAGVWLNGNAVPRHSTAFQASWLTGGRPGRVGVLAPVSVEINASSETAAPVEPGSGVPSVALAMIAYELLGGSSPGKTGALRPLAECNEEANALLRRALTGEFAKAPAVNFTEALSTQLRMRSAPVSTPPPIPELAVSSPPVVTTSPVSQPRDTPPPIPDPLKPKPPVRDEPVPPNPGRSVLVPVLVLIAFVLIAISAYLLTRPRPPGPKPGIDRATYLQQELSAGRAAMERADYQGAQTAYRHVRERDPGSPEAKARLEKIRVFAAGLNSQGARITRQDDPEKLNFFRQAAALGDPNGQVNLGVMTEYGQGGLKPDLTKAVEWYRLAAVQGNALGQAYLADMYENGRGGLKVDAAKALELYRLAANQGDNYARVGLGSMYENGKAGLKADPAKAVELYQLAANQGNARGQAHLGDMYASGKGVPKVDPVKAVELYQLAAKQGSASAQLSLGLMYENGQGGLKADAAKAVELYRLAADQGNAGGQVCLAVMYANGRGGLKADPAKAVELWQRAAAQGSARGQSYLGIAYANGEGGLKADPAKAAEYWQLAAEQGNSSARVNLGAMYKNGQGGLKADPAKALELFRLAAEQGDSMAQIKLGVMYERGEGGLKADPAKAIELYRRAAEQGDALAQVELGMKYEYGKNGLAASPVKAAEYYQMAAAQGNARGQVYLGELYERGAPGIPANIFKAVELYQLSAAQAFDDGQLALGRMYEYGQGGLGIDLTKAAGLYRQAADQGNAAGQAYLGEMYEKGQGGLRADPVAAARLYALAANQGNAYGQVCLGIMYEYGRGGLKADAVKAVELYRKAAMQGFARGQACLGDMYETGKGGLKLDLAQAIDLYRKAVAQGNAFARERLKVLGEE